MTSKIGIILQDGPRYGTGFRIQTRASEQAGMDTYGFTVILHNSVSPIPGAKVMAFYAISGNDEHAVPRSTLSGSPFTTDRNGRFDIVGDLPCNLTDRTSFTVEYDGISTVFQLCSPGTKKAPLPAGVHTSTRTHEVSGTINDDEDGVVRDEVGESEASTEPFSDDGHPPTREPTASYSMRALEKMRPPSEEVPKNQGDEPKTPGISEPEMRKRLSILLGFADAANIKQLLDAIEMDIDERLTRKEAIAIIRNQMDLAMGAVIQSILKRVDETINTPIQQGLEDLARTQHDAEVALRKTAETLTNRIAGQILRQVRRRQAASYLRAAWRWIARAGGMTLTVLAIAALITLYLGLIMR